MNKTLIIVALAFMSLVLVSSAQSVWKQTKEARKELNGKVRQLQTKVDIIKSQCEFKTLKDLKDVVKVVKQTDKALRKISGSCTKKPQQPATDPCVNFMELAVRAPPANETDKDLELELVSDNSGQKACDMAQTWVKLQNASFDDMPKMCSAKPGCGPKLGDVEFNASIPANVNDEVSLTVTSNYTGDCEREGNFKQVVRVKRCSQDRNDVVFLLPNRCGSNDFCQAPKRQTGNDNANAETTTSKAGNNGGGGGGQQG